MPTDFRDTTAMFCIFNSKIQASMLKFYNSAFSHCKQPCESRPLPIFLHGQGLIFSDNDVYILGQMPTNFRDPAAMFSIYIGRVSCRVIVLNILAFAFL